jgi:GntR family transcriptional regulator/MocR family aminotransferase
VSCDAADLVVTAAGEYSLATLARLVAEPGDAILVDDPHDQRRRALFESIGLRCIDGALDAEGLDVESNIDLAARVAHLRPSAEGPLGTVMTAARRYAVMAWVRKAGALVVEDDFDSIVDPRHDLPPSLKAIDSRGRVVYVAALWRSLMPGVGIGFAIAPREIAEAFGAVSPLLGSTPPPHRQLALATFLRSGAFARHVRAMRSVYAERREVMIETLTRSLGGAIISIERGQPLQLVIRLDVADDVEIAHRADVHGFEVIPLSTRAAGHGLIVGYGGMQVPQIRECVLRLAHVIASLRPAPAL